MSNFFEFCEDLVAAWHRSEISLSPEMGRLFQMDYIPEPYLAFGDQSEPLIFLTTNPGAGMPHQHRDARSPRESWSTASAQMAAWYQAHLTGAAARRIKSVLELAKSTGHSGVLQIECVPFHSADLPNKPQLLKNLPNDPLLCEYTQAVKGFLRDRSVVALSAAGTRGSLGAHTIEASDWLRWLADLMGLNVQRAETIALATRGEKITAAFVANRDAETTKGIILTMGSNNMPGRDGVAILAKNIARQ